jgi:hypothetical protein
MNQKLDALVRRVLFGPSPEWPPSDLDKYVFLGRFCTLCFVPVLIASVLGLVFGAPALLWIVLGVGWAVWLTTVVKLPFDIRRERRRAANRGDA